MTIEGNNQDYLKLAPYYEGKFVRYYLNDRNQIFTRSVIHYQDAYPYIQSFFGSQPCNTHDFRLERIWLQGKAIHFKDKDFHAAINNYRVSRDKVLVMSRGNDIFYYGNANNLEKFNKKDILELINYGGQYRRSRLTCYTKLTLTSTTTPYLYISDLIIKDIDLRSKLPGIPCRNPFKFWLLIPSSASTPS